jgi:hypothetical protein
MLMGLNGMARDGVLFIGQGGHEVETTVPLSREFLDKYLGSTLF